MPEEPTELLTVIVPCLNEEENLGATVADVLSVARRLPLRVEVLLIDDGSTDGTARLMENLTAEHSQVRMHKNAENLGLGRSVLRAYEQLDPDSWVTVIPGDAEFLFDSIDDFVALRDRYDVILGYLQNPVIRSIRRRLASQAFTLVANFLYGFDYRYLNGMKMYRAWAFKGIEVRSGGHAYVAELLAKAILRDPRLRIGEAPFAARGRSSGSSKAIRPSSILRALRDVWVGKISVNRYRRSVISGGSSALATVTEAGRPEMGGEIPRAGGSDRIGSPAEPDAPRPEQADPLAEGST